MFWRWFVSDRKVLEALAQSGESYDISPEIARQAPANTDAPSAAQKAGEAGLMLWDDYRFSQEEADLKIEEYWERVAVNKRR